LKTVGKDVGEAVVVGATTAETVVVIVIAVSMQVLYRIVGISCFPGQTIASAHPAIHIGFE
jgi:hypothetical protein